MPMPAWLHVPELASSLEFTSKGQFTKEKVGEVGEMTWHCENGAGGMCFVPRVVGRAELSLRCVSA